MLKENTSNKSPLLKSKLNFSYFPGYANFILKNELNEFVSASLRITREEKIPLLKFFDTLPEKELFELFLKSTSELLDYLAKNKAQEYIDLSLDRWGTNYLPVIQSEDIVSEDITSLSFVRRRVFRNLLSKYTSKFEDYANIMDEVDRFVSVQEERSFRMLFKMKQQKINDHLYFIEKINNTSPGIIYVFDLLEKKEIYSNHQKEMLGLSGNGITNIENSFHTRLIQQKDESRMRKHYEEFLSAKDGEIRTIEYKVTNNNGSSRWLRSYETVFKRTLNGAPLQVIGIALDITKEKETIRQLKHRDQQLLEAQEISGLGTFEWNLLGDDSVFSPQLLKTFELEGKTNMASFMENVHPSDRETLKNAIGNSMKEDGHYECQYRYKKNHHEKVIWSRGVVSFVDGKPSKITGFAMDITKNYSLNEQLKENEKTFRQLIDNAPDSVIVIDDNSRILLWNPKAEEIFGWSEDEALGKTLVETIIPEKYKEAHLAGIKRFQATGVTRVINKTIEITAVNKKKEEFFIALSIATSIWNGKPVFISFIRDISKEKKIGMELEENRNQLTKKNTELERMNNELSSFSYVAGHDLKEPLRKIRTFSNFILEKGNETLTEEIRGYMERIITSTSNMQKLIDDLLAFSRTSSSDKILHDVNLNSLLSEVKNLLKEPIEEKGVIITATQLPTIKAIQFQFQQLLENIISNAIKYSKSDLTPQITITAGMVSGKEFIARGANPEKIYHKISISDNGIGFEQEYAEKIFELFQRLHGKDEYSGSGIGLAICKKIVENHNGFIVAEGKEGVGSTFNIYIPKE